MNHETPSTPKRRWLLPVVMLVVGLVVGGVVGSASSPEDEVDASPSDGLSAAEQRANEVETLADEIASSIPVFGQSPSASSDDAEASTTTKAPTTTAAPTTTKAPTTTAAPRTWTPDDFTVELIVTETSCFDTAGAIVTVEPSLYVADVDTWDNQATVIFEIRGGEHVETKSVDLNRDGTYSVNRERIDTPTCSDTLTAVVTQVLVR